MRNWLVSVVGCLALTACSLGAAGSGTPTVSGEGVIRAAESAAAMTRQAATATPSATPVTPSPTLVPWTPTPRVLSTEEMPVIKATQTAYVRAGPDVGYSAVGLLYSGETALAVGQYQSPDAETWWYVRRPSDGLEGWVWGGAATLVGDPNLVPLRQAPPSPTPGPSPTSTPPLP